ncbi:DUF1573 domain-containing protein [Candidatus Acetothermia bacterium]|nr:DUF1573 domain-containing protein [Candidatus Acetothermia bacterium]
MAKNSKNTQANVRAKTNRNARIILWSAIPVVVLLLGIGIYFLVQSASTSKTSTARATTDGTPVLSITPETQDLGTIDSSKGLVTTYYTVKNSGNGDLVINEMETSCMCTKASLVVNDQEGPSFGMRAHGGLPKGWSARLKPGESAQLKVTYDPNAHGHYVGSVERMITVYSNDPKQPVKQVRFTGDQIGGEGHEH